ncbi:pentatricopeptide repeat-containing protein At4g32450, mitochondrial-like [Papaver somniferum]|uniref:pentatricopeptide repeat-containing protein At4g32450, mitochondrial-like n=1 Tax=Papaver somniferum TaxID=3469 RepID=UPI000E6F859D|nr:pentatricopeptide repeat-containing protein At4g32450, mitochondrial-like [Papaver somniferum]
MERKRATIISIIPKVRNFCQSNLGFSYINSLNRVKTIRTVAAGRTDYQTQPTNNRYGLEGDDFQQTTYGGFQIQNHTPNAYRGNLRDYVHNNFQYNTNGYQNEPRKNQNSSYIHSNFAHNPNEVHNLEQNPYNSRGFERNLNGHYRGNYAPQGPNESSYRKHLLKANRNHQRIINRNYAVNSAEDEVKFKGTLEKMDGFCNEGNVKEALRVLNFLYQQGIEIGLPRCYQLLKVIGEVVAKEEAKLIHNHLMKTKLSSVTTVQNKVLEMYLKCG